MDMIARKKKIMMMQGISFPPEYKKINYIQSGGTQFIDTGFTLSDLSNGDTNWALTFELTELSKTIIIGGCNSLSRQLPIIYPRCELRTDWAAWPSYYLNPTLVLQTNQIYTVEQKNGYLRIGESSRQISSYASDNCHFGIFGKINANGTTETSTLASMKFYKFIVKSNNVLISNIVPCYRRSDNKPGAYDLIRNQFFTNAGSGEFITPT